MPVHTASIGAVHKWKLILMEKFDEKKEPIRSFYASAPSKTQHLILQKLKLRILNHNPFVENMAKTDPLLEGKAGGPGAAAYSSFTLFIYDYFVLKFMAFFFWRCSTSAVLQPFFRSHVSRHGRHLDIGVGTGWFLEHANLSPSTSITLSDLNANCLETTKARLNRSDIDCIQHDILDPFSPDVGTFDSVSLMYLLHCLPPPQSRKGQVLAMLKHHLRPGGVLFGCTILGPHSGNQTWLSKFALKRINSKNRMGNLDDTEEGFVEVLRKHYRSVESIVIGAMLVFTARDPVM